MVASVLAQALARWQHAAGPFWPYVCAAPFLGTGESAQLAAQVHHPESNSVRGTSRASRPLTVMADKLLATAQLPPLRAGEGGWGGEVSPVVSLTAVPGETLQAAFPVILADLPAEPLLAVASLLAERGWYVVPVVQRWIATPAVLPCRPLIERLLCGAWQVRRPVQPRGAILIADGDRTGPVGYPQLAAGRTFDNRYEYQICRFPSTRFLQAQGVRQVTWITAERPSVSAEFGIGQPTLGIPPVARDLHPYREMLLQADIDVNVIVWQLA